MAVIDSSRKNPNGMYMLFGTAELENRGARIGPSYKTEMSAMKAAFKFVREAKARFVRVEHRTKGLINYVYAERN